MATIKDVAKEAGVSVGTVSRYLNGHQLKKNNQLNIQQAIEKLNYRENLIAKGLKNNKILSIGVVVNTLTDVFATSIVSSFEKYVEKHNYSLILCDYQNDTERLIEKLDFLYQRSVSALLLFHVEESNIVLEKFKNKNVPIINIDCPIKDFEADYIVVDNYAASYRATKELIKAGHQTIGMVSGTVNRYIGKQRFSGYQQAMVEQLLFKEELVVYADYSRDDAYQQTLNLIKKNPMISAIYVANYYMRLGVIKALVELKIKIPMDISLIGFDYFDLFDMGILQISAIEQPVIEIGQVAGRKMIERIIGNQNPSQEIMIQTDFIVGESIQHV